MHKGFYASGFLYHPVSQKILLQQQTASAPASSPWELLGCFCKKDNDPAITLKDRISKLLDIKITLVLPIYSYADDGENDSQYIGYSIVRSKPTFSSKDGLTFSWFSFKDVLKLQIKEQTKHDIVVGQRVIEAAERKRLGLHTF